MTPASPPVFGKRGAPHAPRPRTIAAPTPIPSPRAQAVFEAARRELADDEEARPRVVPRSFLAAMLAGLVVALALAGLDVTRADATLHRLAGETGADTSRWLPMLLLTALVGGARAGATSLLLAHAALRRLGHSGHLAYALAGGMVAAALSAVSLAAIGAGLIDAASLPGHGLEIDAAAGAAAGALYRMFAGAKAA